MTLLHAAHFGALHDEAPSFKILMENAMDYELVIDDGNQELRSVFATYNEALQAFRVAARNRNYFSVVAYARDDEGFTTELIAEDIR